MLVTQALFNMAVAVGLAPVTGQPLPLISRAVSYTHLTLPTKRIVEISVVAVTLKKKTKKKTVERR